jgi:acetate CoA/acetoacetate CoA-transferase beta subunit
MEHQNRSGEPKILKECKLPLTAVCQVNMVITEKAVMEVVKGKGLVLLEIAPGLTVEDVQEATEAKLTISDNLKIMEV